MIIIYQLYVYKKPVLSKKAAKHAVLHDVHLVAATCYERAALSVAHRE